MKKTLFFILLSSSLFIVGQIYKHHRYRTLMYALQKVEMQYTELIKEKDKLLSEYHTLMHTQTIENKAKQLGMTKIPLKALKEIHS